MAIRLISLVVLSVGAQLAIGLASPSESNWLSGRSGAGDGSIILGPKRQYLIAPRVGRSPGLAAAAASRQSAGIRSALEEGASFQAPGQIQPHLYGLPRPMKASTLLFLIGGLNRRLRSASTGAGLLPQARIGRRSAPMDQAGLYEHLFATSEMQGGDDDDDDDDEFALATSSNNQGLNEALESLLTS